MQDANNRANDANCADPRAVLTRRSLIALSLTAAALPRAGRAQEMTALALGDARLRVFSDGALVMGGSAGLAPGAPPAEIAALLSGAGLNPDDVRPPLNVTLLERGDRRVLFDAGSGAHFMPSAGRLAASLEAAGVDPASVTDVAFTHAHPDHLWGVIDDFDELAFPEAAYHFPRAEWDFWRDDAAFAAVGPARETFVVGARARMQAIADRVSLFDDGAEVAPGVEAMAAPGHTPGHAVFIAHGGGGAAMVAGDALGHPVLAFQRPRWRMAMDQDADMAAATRLRLLDRLGADRMPVIGYHLTEPGAGMAEPDGDAWRFVPL